MIAEAVAEELGYRCIDRDTIVEKAAKRGVSAHELKNALEKPPAFLDRFGHKRYVYLAVIQAALVEEVRYGQTVYHGHAGHLLLRGGGPVLRVRIIAPMEARIAMAQQRLGLDRKEVAAYIEKVDNERRKWTRFLYGVEWEDPTLYDVVINIEHVDVDNACGIICKTVQGQKCFEFDQQCQFAMDDLVIAARVKADIALNPGTRELELDITAERGEVRIRGRLTSIHQVGEIERIAMAVEGVSSVNLEEVRSMVPA